MKVKLQLLIYFILISFKVLNAQDTPDNYKDRINYIFANVDHSKVTTGLSDYGLQVIPPEYYDGILRDSKEVDINVFRILYAYMDYSRFNGNCALSSQDIVFSAITQNIPISDQSIPIALMCISYNGFREDAYTAGLVTVTNYQIFDVQHAKTRNRCV